MKIILIALLVFPVSLFACDQEITGYVCEDTSWRDPRGLVWTEGRNCDVSGLRVPAADELEVFRRETGTVAGEWCVTNIVHHYFKFPKTPALPFEGRELDFYREEDAYGEFSNFSGFPVFVDGEWWSTSEHYYQAQKYETEELKNWVQFAPTPMEAANRGRDPKIPKRRDWDEVKEGFMQKALADKYTRHPELRELLLSTGNATIFEHTTNDCYWADCGDRSGKNRLGVQLMQIRESLR